MARTILLADDSPTIRKIVELTFSDTEFRVETADNGDAALAKLESLRPDLVLADVVMPDPTGYEICRAVKQSENPVPVMLLAGTFEPFDAELARECGADTHLVKPFESRTLRERVERLLAPLEAVEPVPATEQQADDVEEIVEQLTDEADGEGAAVAAVELEDAEPAMTTEAQAPEDLPEVAPELVDAVAREVLKRLSTDILREVAWEVVPDLAAKIIRERIRELERDDLGGE
jgi:DNA-binding response OmpR family regulator